MDNMDKVLKLREESLRQYKIADHLLNSTLPLVKDPKLLVGILHNINSSLEYALDAILLANDPKLIISEKTTLNYKLDLFRSKVLPRYGSYGLNDEHIRHISKIRDLITLQKKSPVEFKRGADHIICSDDYEIETISSSEMKLHLSKTRDIIDLMDRLVFKVSQNARLHDQSIDR